MKYFFVNKLEKALNSCLRLDPESSSRLTALEDKIITLELSGVDFAFQLKVLHGKIHLQKPVQTPDVIIKGTPLFLLHVSLAKENRKQFFAEDVKIEGDLELGQQIIDLFDELEIDWEEYLSRFIGDVASHQLGNLARRIKHYANKTHEVLLQNVNEYVHEEAEWFPAREALQDFFNEIDEARMDVDRLEQQLKGMK